MIFGFNTDVKVGTLVYHVQSEARQKDLLLETQVFVKGQCIGKCTSPFPEEEVLLDFAEDALQQSLKAQHRRIVAAVRAESLEQELSGAAVTPPSGQAEGTDSAVREAAAASAAPASPAPALEAPAFEISAFEAPAFEMAELQAPALQLDVSALSSPVLSPEAARAEREPPPLVTAAAAPNSIAPSSEKPAKPAEIPATPQHGELLVASPEGLATGSLKIECTNAQWDENEQALLLVLQVHCEETPVDSAALTLRLACGQARPHYAYSSTDGNGVAAVAITIEDASGREGKVLVQAEREGESATRRFHLHPLS
jgi:hypothetical protein